MRISLMVVLKPRNRREIVKGAVAGGLNMQTGKRKKNARKETGAEKHDRKGRDEREKCSWSGKEQNVAPSNVKHKDMEIGNKYWLTQLGINYFIRTTFCPFILLVYAYI